MWPPGDQSRKVCWLLFCTNHNCPREREKAAQTDGGGASAVCLCVFYDIREKVLPRAATMNHTTIRIKAKENREETLFPDVE